VKLFESFFGLDGTFSFVVYERQTNPHVNREDKGFYEYIAIASIHGRTYMYINKRSLMIDKY
jgi:hypothetical protein